MVDLLVANVQLLKLLAKILQSIPKIVRGSSPQAHQCNYHNHILNRYEVLQRVFWDFLTYHLRRKSYDFICRASLPVGCIFSMWWALGMSSSRKVLATCTLKPSDSITSFRRKSADLLRSPS